MEIYPERLTHYLECKLGIVPKMRVEKLDMLSQNLCCSTASNILSLLSNSRKNHVDRVSSRHAGLETGDVHKKIMLIVQ